VRSDRILCSRGEADWKGPLLQSSSATSHLESSVTRLLVATKQLLESLTLWSNGRQTETQVSDVYVRLGNDFNVARAGFESAGISMQ
jgi:hypothetical protein